MSNKYYAVKKGKTPGIYYSWDECKRQIEGVSGAEYKKFSTIAEAEQFISPQKNSKFNAEKNNLGEQIVAYVDGSYSEDYKKYSYGCVILVGNEIKELSGNGQNQDMLDMRNVAGEILASAKAIKWAIDSGYKSIKICYDYEGIEKWATGVWAAKKPGTMKYAEFIKKVSNIIHIEFEKIKAHSGNKYNDKADLLAKSAIDSYSQNNEIENNSPPTKSKLYEIFAKIMSEERGVKENAIYSIKGYIISDARIKKFVKEFWAMQGNKKTDIKQVSYIFNIDTFSISAVITTRDAETQELNIKIQ